MTPIIAPSLLGADFADIKGGLSDIEASGATWIHVDIMDGHFVPTLGFSPKVVQDVRPRTNLFLDVHLMTENPQAYAEVLCDAGADCITFHIEACTHPLRLARDIRSRRRGVGVSLIPSTPVSLIEEMLSEIDQVLVMSVNPGFPGEEFIASSVARVAELARRRKDGAGRYRIAVDGGITKDSAPALIAAGADVIVVGRSFFTAADKAREVALLLAS